jgi:hypothetical protein
MTACVFCSAGKGKRDCPALGGAICPRCCGKHRLVEIACPSDCRWLGGLAIVREGTTGFTKDEYIAATDKLRAYASSPGGAAYHRDALVYLVDTYEPPAWTEKEEPVPEFIAPLLVAYLSYGHRGTDGLRAVDRFIAGFGRALSRGEVGALMALQRAWPSMFEVTSVQSGSGFTAHDRLLDEGIKIREVTGTAQLRRGDVLYSWVMPVGDGMELTGDGIIVPPKLVERLFGELVDELAFEREEHPNIPARQLLGDMADLALAELRDGVAHTPRPQLTTRHGEPLLFCEAHYSLSEPETALARLASHDQLRRDDQPESSHDAAFTWLDPAPNARLAGGQTILGRITIDGKQLVLETHARERLSRGRAMLEHVLGAALVHRADSFTDPDAVLGERAGQGRRPSEESSRRIPSQVEAQLLERVITEHYRGWLDEPVPALGERTPRKVAKTKKGRAEVERLLDEFERSSQRQPSVGPALWNELRRELGIPERQPAGDGLKYDGDQAPDPVAWLGADEEARLRAIRAHHQACIGHPEIPNLERHANFHLVAENQLAAGDPEDAATALGRLIAEGATRHQAVHAIMSVVATEFHSMFAEGRHYDREKVARELAGLRATDC